MNLDYLKIVLRLIHILSGVFWVGGSIIFGFFIGPAVQATGEAGQKFMAHLVTNAKITVRITVSAILTVLAGGWLYWLDSDGLTSAWKNTATGVGFGIGALFALVGLVFGIMVGTNTQALVKIGGQVQGKPTPEQMNQIQTIRKRLALVGPINTFALIIALVCMATSRYW
jgi:uncharacterized membrane protein